MPWGLWNKHLIALEWDGILTSQMQKWLLCAQVGDTEHLAQTIILVFLSRVHDGQYLDNLSSSYSTACL